ncbi:MAG: Fic family protein [Gammaproteobacteria bacterium]|nr:Fic family protein [Gammaproteobacteria bacterium]MBU1647293.1 Fic family protein [Gammaproteobacteria bacterium]MBU1972805.1 Fic family protein [Gammaproteobacteria bacterium]
MADRLTAKVADCIDELLDAEPAAIAFSTDWLRDIHRRLAAELFPDWAGSFRATDVQVGSHLPPPPHDVPVRIRDFCLDLDERLRHVTDVESIAGLLAWADWRFQWIHPFKDFNGRVGRILLVAIGFRLGLPPVDPAATADARAAYFDALRAADAGDIGPLKELWLSRLGG